MTDKKNDGGSAFPVSYVSKNASGAVNDLMHYGGMSLRDYFAAHVSDENIEDMLKVKDPGQLSRKQARYLCADAMLKACDE